MSTVTKWKFEVGDTASILVQLNGIDAILPGATITAHVVRGTTSADVPASIISEPDRVASLTLTTWLNAATPGTYKLRVVLNDLTWPEEGEAEILVLPSSAPAPPGP